MTPERRAEFDELVDALERAYGAFLTVPFGRRSEALSEKLIAARAALTAFVEREEGLPMEGLPMTVGSCGYDNAGNPWLMLFGLASEQFGPRDRVRVVKEAK